MKRQSPRTLKMYGKIVDIINTTNGCFCYTENSVRKIRTPEEIDPENLNDTIPFENTLYRKSGTRNFITARVIIQSKRLLDGIPQNINKEIVFYHLMNIETNLLLCNKIYGDIKKIIIKNRKFRIPVRKGVVDKLPTIDELEIKVYQFLMSAKQSQQIVAQIFNVYHGTHLDGPHVNKIVEEMLKMDSDKSPILSNLIENLDFYKQIADIRNAQEHANKTRYLEIDNYALHKDGKFYEPCLRYYNNGLLLETDICLFMKSVIDGLVQLIEMLMIYNISKAMLPLPKGLSFGVRTIPEEDRNERCPIAKEVQLFQESENIL